MAGRGMSHRGPGMGHGGHGMPGEKARDFKGTMKKLMAYLAMYKIPILFVGIFAVGSTIFNIVGPKILGRATTEIFNGLVGKISGGPGIDFDKIGRILLLAHIPSPHMVHKSVYPSYYLQCLEVPHPYQRPYPQLIPSAASDVS